MGGCDGIRCGMIFEPKARWKGLEDPGSGAADTEDAGWGAGAFDAL